MTSTLIIEDEPIIASGLKRMIESKYHDLKVDAVCYNVKEAEAALNKFQPELVFLDVELGKSQTCFDLLKKISPINFEIIFTTSYNHYAVQAIRVSAVDYLLKPIDELELDSAIEKFRNKSSKIDFNKIESFLSIWANPGNQQNKIPLPTMAGYDMVTVADIIYCEGVGNQTQLVLNNNKNIIISATLKDSEDVLTSYNFFRTHKSYLINLSHVKKYLKNGTVIMSNDACLAVSRSFKEKFTEILKTPYNLNNL
jgi:two-component system LytT family response regulator